MAAYQYRSFAIDADLWGVYAIQQTSSKLPCIENTRANAGRLLEVCWIV